MTASVSTGGVRAFVGLGANLGDPAATLADALRLLGLLPGSTVQAVSPLFRSAPLQAEGPDFVNAVAQLHTVLPARELLSQLQGIEQAHGRTRPFRHAPRTLDLDLLLYGRQVLDEPGLAVPHPRLHLRAFVLEPLLALDPAIEHPRLGPLAPWRERARAEQLVQRL